MPTFPTYRHKLSQCLSPINLGDYFLLIYWVCFRPTALKSYLYRANPVLYRTGPGLGIFRTWQIPAYRNLYLMVPGVVLLIVLFVVLMGLPIWPAISWTRGTPMDWQGWMLDGILRMASGAVFGAMVSIAIGLAAGAVGSITRSVAYCVVNGATRGVAAGVAGGVIASVVVGTVSELLTSLSSRDLLISLTMGIAAYGMVVGIGTNVVHGMLNRVAGSVAAGIAKSAAVSIALILAIGWRNSMVVSVVVGVLFLVPVGVMATIGALRVPFYPFQLILAWRSIFHGKRHPLEWDELVALPLPGVQHTFIRRIQESDTAGLHFLANVVRNPLQRWIAQRTLQAYLHNHSSPSRLFHALLACPDLSEYVSAPISEKDWERLPSIRRLLLGELSGRWVDCSSSWINRLAERIVWTMTWLLRDRRKTPLTRAAGMLYESLGDEVVAVEDSDLMTSSEHYVDLANYPELQQIILQWQESTSEVSGGLEHADEVILDEQRNASLSRLQQALSTFLAERCRLLCKRLAATFLGRLPQISHAVFQVVQEWLRDVLGEPPGAYWMAVLWATVGVTLVCFAAALLENYLHKLDVYSAVESVTRFALPVAVMAAVLHWLTTRLTPTTLAKRALVIVLAVVLALGIYWGLDWPLLLLFDTDASTISTMLTAVARFSLPLLGTLSLTASRQRRPSVGFQLTVVGTIFGTMLAIVLAYPAFMLLLNKLMSETLFTDPHHEFIVVGRIILAVSMGLSVGPIAVVWVQPSTRREQFFVGAAAGLIAGGVLFGLVGAPAAGIAAHGSLYGVAVSRADYAGGAWTPKVGMAINAVVPMMLGATWLLVGGGALIGGATGLLTPCRSYRGHQLALPSFNALLLDLMGGSTRNLLQIMLLGGLTTGTMGLVVSAIQNILDSYGVVPSWQPAWSVSAVSVQFWLMSMLHLVPILMSLHRRGLPFESGLFPNIRTLLTYNVYVMGAVCIVFPIFLRLVLGFFDISGFDIPLLIIAALGLEFVFGVPKSSQGKSVRDDDGSTSSYPASIPWRSREWTGADLIMGLLTGILSYQFIAMVYSVILIAIVMIPELAEATAPPPGLDWLMNVFFDFFLVAQVWFYLLVAFHTLFALSAYRIVHASLLKIALLVKGTRRAHRTERSPHPATMWVSDVQRNPHIAQIVGGLLFVTALGSTLFPPVHASVIAVLAVAATLLLVRDQHLNRLSWPVLLLAFAFAGAGLVGLALRNAYSFPLDTLWLRLTYALAFGPAVAVAYRALLYYTPARSQVVVRVITLLGISLLVGLLGYVSQWVVQLEGGVSNFDGRQWETFTPENSSIGGRLNYQFFSDSRGRLWFGGGTGIIATHAADGWHSYSIRSLSEFPDRSREEMLSARLLFLEDRQGRLWVAEGTTFGQFDPALEETAGDSLRVPSHPWTEAGLETLGAGLPQDSRPLSVTLTLACPITGMALDTSDNLWLATLGCGALRLEGSRELNDARWDLFTAGDNGLTSNNVHSIYADQAGNTWFGVTGGWTRFTGAVWQTIAPPDMDTNAQVVTFLGDSEGRLWAGTTDGGFWGAITPEIHSDSGTWTPFDDMAGWPGESGIKTLFEDSQGGLWAGTDKGALRFDGQQWMNLVPDIYVTTISEGPPDIIWLGGHSGLVRYDLAEDEQSLFDADNSGMVTDEVQDAHVDPDGELWVSTFAIDRTYRSPWWVIGLNVLFFGYLFANTYRGYERAPGTRARRLARRVMAEPESLYRVAYTVLADSPDASDVLTMVARHMRLAGDSVGADAVIALTTLSFESKASRLGNMLRQTTAALAADSGRVWADALHRLHHLLAVAVDARRIPEIVGIELIVDPGRETGIISLRSRSESIEELPPFLSQGSAEAWRTLERVNHTLRKYQEVDTVTDRLNYLAEAIAAIDAAQAATKPVGPPEGIAMTTIVDRWRKAVTNEIEMIIGQADLRLELRTRQVRRAERVTVALRLQNTGRAVAENVVITLQSGEGFSPVGGTQVTLERLSSEHSTSVEFAIAPTDAETVRVACRVTWDDHLAKGNEIEFADVVRFYEIAEEFHRILNPYIVGHPIKSAEMFHGREDVFRFVADNLGGPVQDRTLVLHGQRRTGKTSILYQLLQGRLGERFIPVLIDMQELALLINSTGDFLNELAYQLARTVRKVGVDIKEPAEESFAVSPTRAFNRFLDALEDSLIDGDRRVVIMFDEFELIESRIADGKLDADLLGYFRSLMQHRDCLVFIFTGTHQLEEMSHDYWSIFFNIALYRRVSFLSSAEATRLIREPVAGALDVDELAVDKIINLTSGHPYFVQLICWALVNHCNVQERNYATINDVNEVVHEILMTGEAHFAFIWQQATGTERLALAGLAHTLRPGKAWARPDEILSTLIASGDTPIQRMAFVNTLDQLATQEVLRVAGDGALRYCFQLGVLQLWVETTKSIAALLERVQ